MPQEYTSNWESMKTLKQRIESLNSTLRSFFPEQKSDAPNAEPIPPNSKPCPPKLKERLRIFEEYVNILTPQSKDSISLYNGADAPNAPIGT